MRSIPAVHKAYTTHDRIGTAEDARCHKLGPVWPLKPTITKELVHAVLVICFCDVVRSLHSQLNCSFHSLSTVYAIRLLVDYPSSNVVECQAFFSDALVLSNLSSLSNHA